MNSEVGLLQRYGRRGNRLGRTHLIVLAALSLPALSRASDVLASMREQLASEIRYAPPPESEASVDASGLELVVLDRMVVENRSGERVTAALEQKRQEALDEKFDLKNGGTLLKTKLGRIPVKLGVEYTSTPGRNGVPPPVFTLISIK